ncbi:MAG: ABC transporter ATP-binding protein, partial [Phycisphaerae bacterium]
MGWWNARKRWSVELPELDEPDPETPWRIGAIVGPSGSGKSVIARSHYGKAFVEGGYRWPASKAVVDGWPEKISVRVITGMLNSVGFSSPPDWIKPYGALNNGQRFRCDLARALFTDDELIAFDEFTSVVDRQVAQFGAAAVAKTLRKGRAAVRRFVAVTCHYDVLDWLQPDWVLDLGAGGRLARGWLRRSGLVASERPRIQLEVRTGDRAAWDMFSQHHYLSARLHHAARIYLGWWRDVPVAFCATIAN